MLALTVSCAYAVPYGAPAGLGLGLAHPGNLGLGIAHEGGLALAQGSGGFAGSLGFGLGGHGYGGGMGLAHPGNLGLGLAHGAGGFTGSLGFGIKGHGYGGGYGRAVHPAAIQSTRSYEVVPVALPYEPAIPQTIDVPPNIQPVEIVFRTQSSPMNMLQIHTPGAPQFESTRSEDQESVLTHESYRPVIQEYREVIQPFRNIEQKVLPVLENVHTVVAKGDEYRAHVGYGAPLLTKGVSHY